MMTAEQIRAAMREKKVVVCGEYPPGHNLIPIARRSCAFCARDVSVDAANVKLIDAEQMLTCCGSCWLIAFDSATLEAMRALVRGEDLTLDEGLATVEEIIWPAIREDA